MGMVFKWIRRGLNGDRRTVSRYLGGGASLGAGSGLGCFDVSTFGQRGSLGFAKQICSLVSSTRFAIVAVEEIAKPMIAIVTMVTANIAYFIRTPG